MNSTYPWGPKVAPVAIYRMPLSRIILLTRDCETRFAFL